MKTQIRMNVVVTAVLACGLGSAALAQSEESSWDFSFGYVYRTFDDIELHGFQRADAPGQYLNYDGVALEDPVLQNLGPNPTVHGNFDFAGADADMDESGGFEVIAAQQPSSSMGGFDMELSMVFISQDMNMGVDGIDVDERPLIGGVGGAPGAPTTNQLGFADYDLDLTLVTYGLGARKVYECNNWYVSGGAGPTLSLVNYTISRRSGVEYLGADLGQRWERDDDFEFSLGVYGRVAAGYEVRENIFVEVGARYDWMEDAETDFADLQLSGLSGDIALTFKF